MPKTIKPMAKWNRGVDLDTQDRGTARHEGKEGEMTSNTGRPPRLIPRTFH